jgi:hypothetical protein
MATGPQTALASGKSNETANLNDWQCYIITRGAAGMWSALLIDNAHLID